MKLAALILGELAIAGLLAVLIFVVLLYQPAWIWIAAPLVMLGGFVGIIAWAKSDPGRARLLTLLCPLAYTVWLVGLGLSIQSGGWQVFLAAAGYYAVGVLATNRVSVARARLPILTICVAPIRALVRI